MVIEFDRKVLFDDFIPALVNRHFAAHFAEYHVAIVSRSNGSVIYKSAPEIEPSSLAAADLRLSLFNPLFSNEPGGRRGGGAPLQFDGGRPQPGGAGGRGPRGFSIALGSWELLINHRSGSLEAAIESVRRRNLAISFGILLLLTASVVLVVVSSHRARALAQLQMDFVARVSHELRTPLAIIRSAAYNVANGVVTDEKEVREYATMVQTEGQRLSHMVDQILTFSRTGAGHATYDIKPVRIEEIVDHVIATMAATLSHADCKLDRDIAPNLPPVKADESALSECIQNLVSNAVKYGRSSSGIHIRIDARQASASTVSITVADSGPGIDSADLPQIFEPFFRGKNARSDTPGSGLGLNLVSRMMDAQGGRIPVESEPGKGATFTLHLSVALEATS
jgi:signal transduction histidine kinase